MWEYPILKYYFKLLLLFWKVQQMQNSILDQKTKFKQPSPKDETKLYFVFSFLVLKRIYRRH